MPDAGAVIDYNRFLYARANPLRHVDSSGHCIDGVTTIVCVAVLLKVVDYGWSAYDAYNSSRVLADPTASRDDKLMAGLNIALTVLFEAVEPDDFLPVGLPADDIARRAMMKGVREAYAEGGEEAMERFLREQMGDQADELLGKVDELLGAGCSFISETPVMTQQGQMAIDQLQVGDWVMAYDQTSGRTGIYPVTATFNHLDPVVVVLVIDGERIETTPEHPFYANKSWVAAADLRIGDGVRRADGSIGLVDSVRVERRTQRMYNLTVARAHTFFVGDDGWLVHNACLQPSTPKGMSNRSFNEQVMKWGTGSEAARQRASTITLKELEDGGVTVELAQQWRDWYSNILAQNPKNPSAAGRVDLMNRAIELLQGGR